MAAQLILWREPEVFASGDTLIFQRSLSDYIPNDGWSIQGTLTLPATNGGSIAAQYVSTPDASGRYHCVNVPNFGAGLDGGDYILTEEVVNANTGEKHRIYYGTLSLDPDLAGGAASQPVTTFAQRMIPILEEKIARLEAYDLTETDVQRTRFVVEDKAKTYERYWRLLEFRNWEKKQQVASNTGIDQSTIRPVFAGGW